MRHYASAVLAMALCPSVCLSVCLSQAGIVYRNGWMDQARTGYNRHIPHCVVREFGYLQNKATFLSNFVPNSGLRKISPRHIDRRKRCQLSSTDDRRQFITLSVHLRVQHSGREAARCSGQSAAIETWSFSLALRRVWGTWEHWRSNFRRIAWIPCSYVIVSDYN